MGELELMDAFKAHTVFAQLDATLVTDS